MKIRYCRNKRGFWRKEFLSGLWLSFPKGTSAAHKESGLKVSCHNHGPEVFPESPVSIASSFLFTLLSIPPGWSTWGKMHSSSECYKRYRVPTDQEQVNFPFCKESELLVWTTQAENNYYWRTYSEREDLWNDNESQKCTSSSSLQVSMEEIIKTEFPACLDLCI